jgi:hypothetical protein
MAIRDWGGGGDLSGLFTGLQDQFLSSAEAARNRLIARSEEDQAAEDAETYDEWVNGKITDEQWLQYIRRRMRETKGDSRQHQQWEQTFNEHSMAIEDGRIETRYLEGEITIHRLVDYYSDRMANVERRSPEYRELADRYYNLVDKRDGDFIDEQSEALIDKIERGQASYSELLSFYETQLSKTRKSSPLYAQIRRQITSIRQIVDGIGGSSGGGGGGSRGGGSGGGSSSDPGVVNNIKQANNAVVRLYRSGNVFVPTGSSMLTSVFDVFNVDNNMTNILEAMKADSMYYEDMMETWSEDPDAPILRNALGDQLPNTAENRWATYNQALANYDYRIALINAKGDFDGAVTVVNARDAFVDQYMRADNSMQAEPMWQLKREAFFQKTNLAGQAPDPYRALEAYASAARSFAQGATYIINESNFVELRPDEQMIEELRYAQELGQFIEGAGNQSPEEILTAGSMLFDKRPEGFYLTAEQLAGLVGSIDGPTGSGLAGQAAARDGLAATNAIRGGQPALVEPWVYVAVPGESAPKLVKQSMVGQYLTERGVTLEGDWREAVRPFAEKVMANQTPSVVYRVMEPYQAPKWWQDDRGRWIPYSEVEAVGRDPQKIADEGWVEAVPPDLVGWNTVTDAAGRTWYVDPTDGQLYERLPFMASMNGAFDVSDLINENGELDLTRKPGATGLVMGVGPGVSLRLAQRLVGLAAASGEIDLELYHDRDVQSGRVTFDPLGIDDLDGMYWSTADAAMEALSKWKAQENQYDPQRELVVLAHRNEQRRLARIENFLGPIDELRQNDRLAPVVPELLNNIDPIVNMASQFNVNLAAPKIDRVEPLDALKDIREFKPTPPRVEPVTLQDIKSPGSVPAAGPAARARTRRQTFYRPPGSGITGGRARTE